MDSLERKDTSSFVLYKPSSANIKEATWDCMGLGTGDQWRGRRNGRGIMRV